MYLRLTFFGLSLVALCGAASCEDNDRTTVDPGPQPPPAQMPNGDASVEPPTVDAGRGDAGDGDAGDAGPSCAQRAQRLTDWTDAHLACNADADCRIVADCGPFGDAFPVNAAGLEQAEWLFVRRCSPGLFDNMPIYAPRCREQQCVLGEELTCCGCPPPESDAGGDAGQDAG
jgi:hypothetical protein